MAVDDAKVQAHVDRALRAQSFSLGWVDRIQYAWFMLKNERDVPGKSLDEDLAAAEHYMYARYAVANGDYSYGEMYCLCVGYDVLKWVGIKWKTSANPTARASQASISWGIKGAQAGANDLMLHNLN